MPYNFSLSLHGWFEFNFWQIMFSFECCFRLGLLKIYIFFSFLEFVLRPFSLFWPLVLRLTGARRSFRGVVVITFASHAKGPWSETRRKHWPSTGFCFFFSMAAGTYESDLDKVTAVTITSSSVNLICETAWTRFKGSTSVNATSCMNHLARQMCGKEESKSMGQENS